jgi:hypothetical protein
LFAVDDEQILSVLTRRQFTQPHASIRSVLEATIAEIDCCPIAVESAIQWLQIDWEQPVGRLRRTELTQLARSIYRFWRQSVTAQS